MKTFALSLFAILNATACGFSTEPNSDARKIIGENDLVVVAPQGENLPERFRPLIDAFGLMEPMGCTATHIGNGLVLSAGHCFENKELAADVCKQTTVQFGFRKDVAPYLTTKCVEVLAMELSDAKDFVLFRVADVPHAKVEVELVKKPTHGSSVTIFGHPRERPLEWSKNCKIAKARVLDETILADFTHRCDTEPASSGSVVISTTSLKIVGIHNGSSQMPWNYGTLLATTPELLPIIEKTLLLP